MDGTAWLNFENIMLREKSQSQKKQHQTNKQTKTFLCDSISIKCPQQSNMQVKKVETSTLEEMGGNAE